MGTITPEGYIPTRTFELTVHSLDLVPATGLGVPADLGPIVGKVCQLAGALAGRHLRTSKCILAMTGRIELPKGISVL